MNPILSVSLSGAPVFVTVEWAGDMWECRVLSEDMDGNETTGAEYFAHYADAVAYAETFR